MNQFALRLLGAIQLHNSDNQDVPFRSRRAVALLVYLIMQARPIPRPELVELIWPDKTEKQGRGNLRWALSYLAKVLPDAIQRTRHTVHFELPPNAYVDLLAMQEALTNEDYETLATIVRDVQGEFLAGFYFDESAEYETWLITQRETWRLKLFSIFETLIERHDATGDYAAALEFAEKWLAFESWEERAHRWAMLLLARLGRVDAALEQYARCWRLLAEELGTEPTDETTALYQRLQANGNQPRHNLPAQPNDLVGRSADIEHITTLTRQQTRLITIVGAGGMGKTRLAIAAAAQLADQFLDGVIFIDLTSLSNTNGLAGVLFQTLSQVGIPLQKESNLSVEQQLVQTVSDRNMLIVLDNMEHLLSGVSLLLTLLQKAPRLQLLVTSRERLNIRWETLVEIDGLPAKEAFDLFVQGAKRQRVDFEVTSEDRLCIEEICELTAGMPLAIELAAVWMRLRTCDEIVQAIRENLDFLSSRQRDLPDRHRSVRAAFEHSWQRLSADEQQVLTRLTLFRGGFSADAAQQVADATWAKLAPLVDKSLVRQWLDSTMATSQVRYDMHPLLRQFSAEKQRDATTSDRHAAYFANFLAQHNDAIQQGDAAALNNVAREWDNVRLAWEHSIAHRQKTQLWQMVIPLGYFLDMRCRWSDTISLYQPIIDHTTTDEDPLFLAIRAVALATSGNALTRLMAYKHAETDLSESLTLFQHIEHTEGIAFCLFALARTAHHTNATERAWKLYKQSHDLAKERNDLLGMARANVNRADIAFTTGDYKAGEQLARQALTQFEQFGDQRGVAVALLNLGRGDIVHNRLAKAIKRTRHAATLATEIGATQVRGDALWVMGQAQFYAGDYQAAESTLRDSHTLFSDIGADAPVVQTWSLLARLALARGDAESANKLIHRVKRLSDHLDYMEGKVWGLSLTGQLALADGELISAENALRQALQLANKLGHTPLILDIVTLMAQVYEQQDAALARSMFGMVNQHPASTAFLQKQVATRPMDESPPSLNLLLPTLLTD